MVVYFCQNNRPLSRAFPSSSCETWRSLADSRLRIVHSLEHSFRLRYWSSGPSRFEELLNPSYKCSSSSGYTLLWRVRHPYFMLSVPTLWCQTFDPWWGAGLRCTFGWWTECTLSNTGSAGCWPPAFWLLAWRSTSHQLHWSDRPLDPSWMISLSLPHRLHRTMMYPQYPVSYSMLWFTR